MSCVCGEVEINDETGRQQKVRRSAGLRPTRANERVDPGRLPL